MKHGKKYIDAAKLIENNKTYDPNEALELCCKTATAKFDETVELHVRLGVDSRHATSRSAALSSCPTAPVRTSALSPSPRATPPRPLRLPVRRRSVMTI